MIASEGGGGICKRDRGHLRIAGTQETGDRGQGLSVKITSAPQPRDTPTHRGDALHLYFADVLPVFLFLFHHTSSLAILTSLTEIIHDFFIHFVSLD